MDDFLVGLVITSSDNAVIGLDFGNAIAGNGADVLVDAAGVTVIRNSITGNARFGMLLSGSGAVSGNTITANGSGVTVLGSDNRYTISRNSIFDNQRLGIDLGAFGVTKNDGQDKDGGANDGLNFPEFRHARDDGTTTAVEGKVEYPDPQSLTLEIFVNEAPDPPGFGEGQSFLATATPDAKGRFTASLPGGLAGSYFAATATDSAGNTSEFSEVIEVTPGK